jgi:tRNA threonylcarbamoyladenosine biosynthesis protein TsaE
MATRSSLPLVRTPREREARAKTGELVEGTGFEPATPASRTLCATGLRHPSPVLQVYRLCVESPNRPRPSLQGRVYHQKGMPPHVRTIHSHSSADTIDAGCALGTAIRPGTLIAVHGDLGVGKTVFARGIAQALGISDWCGSPTFTLVHEYVGRVPMFHVDAYRITSAEFIELDAERMIAAAGLLVVEWAGNIDPALNGLGCSSMVRVWISDVGEDERLIEIRE